MKTPLRILFPSLCLAVLPFLAAPCHGNEPDPDDRPPNILFIAIDDLKPILGSMAEDPGNFLNRIYPDPGTRNAIKEILTPNIDRLGSQGINFHRAYCPSSVCRPSRTALLTGYRPHVSGVTSNSDGYFRLPDKPQFLREVVTLPQYFKEHGYVTYGTGKLFHTGGDDEADPELSWTTWFNKAPAPEDIGKRSRNEWAPPRDRHAKMIFGTDSGPVEGQPDYGNADLIARLLTEGQVNVGNRSARISPDQPFFLGCGIFRPHLPHFAPQELVDLFDIDDIQVNRETLDTFFNDMDDVEGWRPKSRFDGPLGDVLEWGLELGKKRGLEEGDIRAYKEALRHYLACSALADRCVERLLDALAESPYADNTIVVLWSDHGWYLGEKYLFLKTRIWDEASNCVLVIHDPRPGREAAGSPCYIPVNLQDLYPTLASLAGLKRPDHVAGVDISPLLKDPATEWPVPALTTWGDGEAIRFGEWAYLRYGQDPNRVELYNVREDPDEMTNLARQPEYKDRLAELDALLNCALQGDRFGQ